MNFADIDKMLNNKTIPLAVCMPEEEDSIVAAYELSQKGFIKCIFVGHQDVIKNYIDKYAPGFCPEIINAETPEEAAFKTVELVRLGKAAAIEKGNISTPILLKAVLNSQTGIKDSKTLSHVLVYEWEGRLRFVTDGGMIPYPTFEDKIEIINNAKKLAKQLGFDKVRVAAVSATEQVNPKIQSSIEAAALSKMSERGQFGDDCIVEGPLGMDVVICPQAAKTKGITCEVTSNADVILCADIDSGNIFGKTILYYGNTSCAGLIIGAKCPVIMLSRSDTKETRINSVKLALATSFNR